MSELDANTTSHAPHNHAHRASDWGSALHNAAMLGDCAAIERLLGAGADPRLANRAGMTPLRLAIHANKHEAIKVLCAGGPETISDEAHGAYPLLVEAAQMERPDCVRALLAAGADPNVATNLGNTALHWAARTNAINMAQALLDAGANPFAVDKQGKTPMEQGGPGRAEASKVIAAEAMQWISKQALASLNGLPQTEKARSPFRAGRKSIPSLEAWR